MPTSLTLKNIPDDIYERLKASAQRNHRSLNSEVMVCLETVLLPAKVPPEERLSRARMLRRSLPEDRFKVCDIDSFKREGRA
jgi:plasmid stability protein